MATAACQAIDLQDPKDMFQHATAFSKVLKLRGDTVLRKQCSWVG